jgi:hypothetical protein
MIGVPIAAVCLFVQGQDTPAKDARVEAKGMPPRAAPADYQAHAQAGTLTIAADFDGHSIPTLQGTFSSEDYVTVETGVFGPPGARTKLSPNDFGLRINGKKTPSPSQPYGMVAATVKDPEWAPPEPAGGKSKSGPLSTGGAGGQGGDSSPTPTPKPPFELTRTWALQVQKVVLPEGDRPLPQAGLLFFEFHGKTARIRSVELVYTGPAGKATLALQP